MPRQWFQSRQATPRDSAASMTPTQEFIPQYYRQHYADKRPELSSTDESRLYPGLPGCVHVHDEPALWLP